MLDEHRGKRAKPRVAIGRRDDRRRPSGSSLRSGHQSIRRSFGKRFEPQKEPVRIVGHLQHERAVARKGQRHRGALEVVRGEPERSGRERQRDRVPLRLATPDHVGYHRREI
jgi:hypothetical protein